MWVWSIGSRVFRAIIGAGGHLVEHELHSGGILSASTRLLPVDLHSFLLDVVGLYEAGLPFAEAFRLALSRHR